MKKKMLLISLIATFVFPVFGEASSLSVQESTLESVQVSQNSVAPRTVFLYIFSSVPPKTFNGRTRIYYEYKAKEKYYVGYYQ